MLMSLTYAHACEIITDKEQIIASENFLVPLT